MFARPALGPTGGRWWWRASCDESAAATRSSNALRRQSAKNPGLSGRSTGCSGSPRLLIADISW